MISALCSVFLAVLPTVIAEGDEIDETVYESQEIILLEDPSEDENSMYDSED